MIRSTVLAMLWASTAAGAEVGEFQSARPVWVEGRETEMNLFVGFRAVFDRPTPGPTVLRVTGHTVYRAFVNGQHLGYGPARAGHGYYRLDEWDLTDHLKPGRNVVAIEVAGYNSNSYYLLDLPSFVQAEVVSGGGRTVVASTAGQGIPFEAAVLPERVQKVCRYSFQRPFSEVYRLSEGWDRWRADPAATFTTAKAATVGEKKILPRRVGYPTFDLRPAVQEVSRGTVKTGVTPKNLWKDRALTGTGPKLKGYPEKDLATIPTIELQSVARDQATPVGTFISRDTKLTIANGRYEIVDLGTNLTGFPGFTAVCREKTRLFLTFDEVLTDGDVDFKRLGCANVVLYELAPGTYRLETFEPYTLRYAKLLALEGSCEVSQVTLREFANPQVWDAHFACSDERINRLFAAGRETFAQNAVDVFMDCPHRERAGWLCDSFFTSRTAFDLSGRTAVEHNFFENFLLPAGFAHLPAGMLPMCYPADHYDGVFIPNWALWFVVQLEEYADRGGDRAVVDGLKAKVLDLFKYFQKFRNSDGLLEKLESWVFVEWSEANRFVQDVNYPSNMLYAAALTAAGRMYGLPDLTAEAERLREVIRTQSWKGDFFADHAVRKAGKLEVLDDKSEVCQYFAFFFDVARPETHGELWKTLREKFGPDRKDTKAFPQVHIANSFVGNMLRFEILSRDGQCRQILDESIAYLLYMADRTGTLWENVGAYASCNHGFASHIVHTLYRDVLGIRRIDPVRKVIDLRLPDVQLTWCEGRIPLADGPVSLRWWKEGTKTVYRAETPAGYELKVESTGGTTPDRRP